MPKTTVVKIPSHGVVGQLAVTPLGAAGIVNSLLGWAVCLVCCRRPAGTTAAPRAPAAASGPEDQRTGLLTTQQPAAGRVSLVTANGS